MSTSKLVSIGGNPVPLYPFKAWSRLPAGVNLDDLWQLVHELVTDPQERARLLDMADEA